MVMEKAGLNLSALKNFIDGNAIPEFLPVAYYDKHLDCIRVQIEDCSFMEERVNDIISLWFKNHTGSNDCIGFTIKGIKHLCLKLGLQKDEPVYVAQVMNAMLQKFPDQTIYSVIEKVNEIFVDFLYLPINEADEAFAA